MKKYKVLITVTIFISLLFVLLSNYFLKEMQYQNYVANNFYTENTLEFYNDNNLKKYLFHIQNNSAEGISLNIEENNVRRIAMFNNVSKPKIIDGRFLMPNDFYDSNNYAVVCEKMGKNVKEFIEIGKIKYEIIGTYKESSFSSDDVIFTNLKEDEIKYSKTIKIDYNNNHELYQSAKDNKNLSKVTDELILFFDSTPFKTIISIVTVLFCLSILIVMYFYVEDKKEEIKIKYIFGYTFLKIYLDGLIDILSCLFIAWIILLVLFLDISSYIYFLFSLVLMAIALYIPMTEIINGIKLEKKYEDN